MFTILVNALLIWLVSGWRHWWDLAWLTDAFTIVQSAIVIMLALSIAASVVLVCVDPAWLQGLLEAFTAAVGLAVMLVVAMVFPFDFDAGTPWTLVVRLAVWAAVIGMALAILVNLVRFVRGLVRPGVSTE